MADDIRATRKHRIIAARATQLSRNLLACQGGYDYIQERLSRAACESEISWRGNAALGMHGRVDRAFLLNYAARIATKINQYVFGQDVQREGIDEQLALDVTRTGMSVTQFMERVSLYYTAAGWAWVGVDRGAAPVDAKTGQVLSRSVADRERIQDRVWWTLWKPTEVIDWSSDSTGALRWLITEEWFYANESPLEPAKLRKVRTIWEKGGGTRLVLAEDDHSKIESEQAFTISAPIVPFVLVGQPSADPWWFDDVERVQASLLNLDSLHDENLVQSVFPQLVIPESLIESIRSRSDGSLNYQQALELVRGLSYPILEPTEASGLTRYLTPNASDLKAIPDEIQRRRKELFDIVGLAMGTPESRQVQSAEAKQWDHLDPSSVLKERAIVLEEAEERILVLSKALDTGFQEYSPAYPRQFQVSDAAADLQALLNLSNVDLPDGGRREVMRAFIELLDRVVDIPDDRKAAIFAEIEAMEFGGAGALAAMFSRRSGDSGDAE